MEFVLNELMNFRFEFESTTEQLWPILKGYQPPLFLVWSISWYSPP
jgi:hypothetical protein